MSKFRLPRLLRIGLYSLFGLILLGLVLALATPPLLKPWLEGQLGQSLARRVEIGSLEINPLQLKLVLGKVTIGDASGALMTFKQLTLNVDAVSLTQQALVLHELALDGATLNLVRTSQDRFNFSDLLASKPETATLEATKPVLPRFVLHNIRVENSQISLDDRVSVQRQLLY